MTRRDQVLLVDLGTTRTKFLLLSRGDDRLSQHVISTPAAPEAILDVIQRTRRDSGAGLVAVASFRRAIVDAEDRLVLIRDRPPSTSPHDVIGTDFGNPLATTHRWASDSRDWFSFDSWLSLKLSGVPTISPSMAWLSGIWDFSRQVFDPRALALASDTHVIPELPAVLSELTEVDGILLPILGDHEATAVAAFATRGELSLLECGTALASLVQRDSLTAEMLGLFGPPNAGYSERIDPLFARRVHGHNPLPAPDWTGLSGDVTLKQLCTEVARIHLGKASTLDGPVAVAGGNASVFLESLPAEMADSFQALADKVSPIDGLSSLVLEWLDEN